MVYFSNPVDTSRLAKNVSTNVQQLETPLLVDPKKRAQRVRCSRKERESRREKHESVAENARKCWQAFKIAQLTHMLAFKNAREVKILSLLGSLPLHLFLFCQLSLEIQVFFSHKGVCVCILIFELASQCCSCCCCCSCSYFFSCLL